MAETADVLIQNLAPGALDRYGLGYEELAKVNPRLIVAFGSGFGSFGPYSGHPAMDLTIPAATSHVLPSANEAYGGHLFKYMHPGRSVESPVAQ